jgi:hypothetical protein
MPHFWMYTTFAGQQKIEMRLSAGLHIVRIAPGSQGVYKVFPGAVPQFADAFGKNSDERWNTSSNPPENHNHAHRVCRLYA